MFRKTVLTTVALAMSVPLCAEINFDNPNANDFNKELLAVKAAVSVPSVAAPAVKADKEWTIMVFVNGKNNLEPFALKDMNEMEMVGSSDKVNVVVEIGRMAGYDSSDGNWVGSKRYLVQKDNNPNKVTSPVLQDLGKQDMGDYKHLVDFGKWAKATFPAKKYMLIVWNHGSGWDKKLDMLNKGISYDDETGSHINTPQLGLALKEIGDVSLYGSDACYMQMPEVVYELKNYTEYIVGSEETEPGDGYTYNDLLAPLIAKPDMSVEQLGILAVDAYSDHYQQINEGSTQSLVKTAALDGFLAALNDFASAMMAANEKPLIKQAMSGALTFSSENKDLWHFTQLLLKNSKNDAVIKTGKALQEYITGNLVVHNRAVGGAYANSYGIASYMPGYRMNPAYNELAWAKASSWDEFLTWYLKK